MGRILNIRQTQRASHHLLWDPIPLYLNNSSPEFEIRTISADLHITTPLMIGAQSGYWNLDSSKIHSSLRGYDLDGIKFIWPNSVKKLMTKAGMVPVFISRYEELKIRNGINMPDCMIKLNKIPFTDNKVVIIWRRMKGNGSIYVCTYHKDGQIHFGHLEQLRRYK